jgi:hypothetical protein
MEVKLGGIVEMMLSQMGRMRLEFAFISLKNLSFPDRRLPPQGMWGAKHNE